MSFSRPASAGTTTTTTQPVLRAAAAAGGGGLFAPASSSSSFSFSSPSPFSSSSSSSSSPFSSSSFTSSAPFSFSFATSSSSSSSSSPASSSSSFSPSSSSVLSSTAPQHSGAFLFGPPSTSSTFTTTATTTTSTSTTGTPSTVFPFGSAFPFSSPSAVSATATYEPSTIPSSLTTAATATPGTISTFAGSFFEFAPPARAASSSSDTNTRVTLAAPTFTFTTPGTAEKDSTTTNSSTNGPLHCEENENLKDGTGVCAVCFEAFCTEPVDCRPRLLRCGHSFCTRCLTLLPQVLSKSFPSVNGVACPKCRQHTPLDHKGIPGLPFNFDLLELLRLREQEVKKEEEVEVSHPFDSELCGNCRKTTATKYCLQCSGHLCATCDQQLHARPLFRSHKRLPRAEAPVFCQVHGEKKLKYWCTQESCAVCTACLLIGDHKNHHVIPLEDEGARAKTQAIKTLQELEAETGDVDVILDNLANIGIRESQTAQTARMSIKWHFDQLRAALARREKELDQQVDDWERNKALEAATKTDKLNQVKAKLAASTADMRRIAEAQDGHSIGLLLAKGETKAMEARAQEACQSAHATRYNTATGKAESITFILRAEELELLEAISACGSLHQPGNEGH